MKTLRQNYEIKKEESHSKSALIQNVIHLIRKKKSHFTQEGLGQESSNDYTLPLIYPKSMQSPNKQSKQYRVGETEFEEMDKKVQMVGRSPANKYKTVLCTTEEEQKVQDFRLVTPRALDRSVINVQIYTNSSKMHNNRIKSEHQQNTRKTTMKHKAEESLITEIVSKEDSKDVIAEAKKQFMEVIKVIPKQIKYRNEATLKHSIKCLEAFNPFFNRNHRIVNVCLLKVGRIIEKNDTILYRLGEQLSYFYLILSGKVKLINGGLKRVCKTGETVLEEILFLQKNKKIALEKAKVIGQVCLLEISLSQFQSMKEEMIKHRFKLQMQEMEVLIKRNFIIKNWLRNKVRLQAQI